MKKFANKEYFKSFKRELDDKPELVSNRISSKYLDEKEKAEEN